jgi:hypothetical protein
LGGSKGEKKEISLQLKTGEVGRRESWMPGLDGQGGDADWEPAAAVTSGWQVAGCSTLHAEHETSGWQSRWLMAVSRGRAALLCPGE